MYEKKLFVVLVVALLLATMAGCGPTPEPLATVEVTRIVTESPQIQCTPVLCEGGVQPVCPAGRECPGGCGADLCPTLTVKRTETEETETAASKIVETAATQATTTATATLEPTVTRVPRNEAGTPMAAVTTAAPVTTVEPEEAVCLTVQVEDFVLMPDLDVQEWFTTTSSLVQGMESGALDVAWVDETGTWWFDNTLAIRQGEVDETGLNTWLLKEADGSWPEVVAWREVGRPRTLVLIRGGQPNPDQVAATYYKACQPK